MDYVYNLTKATIYHLKKSKYHEGCFRNVDMKKVYEDKIIQFLFFCFPTIIILKQKYFVESLLMQALCFRKQLSLVASSQRIR